MNDLNNHLIMTVMANICDRDYVKISRLASYLL